MLRRKLMITLGSLVLLLVAVTATAVGMLQRILKDMDHIQTHAAVLVDDTFDLGRTVTMIEVELYELELGHDRHLDALIEGVESLRALVGHIGESYVIQGDSAKPGYGRIQALLPEFEVHVGSLATTRDAQLARHHTQEALKVSIAIRREALALNQVARNHAQEEREALVSEFRWLVLGLSLLFLLVIDVAVMMLWRTASMIVRPVDRLVEASRQLADEHFDYRVAVEQKDEFDELGRAYNRLAERLQAHEQRRMEVLVQVSRTLNHELNNAIAIIELQLTLLQDNMRSPEGIEKCLRQIRENLERMTRTVQSLKEVRRVVLTEYAGGEKMLDLEQSLREEPPVHPSPMDAQS
jgi:signal transduction histidine kinase